MPIDVLALDLSHNAVHFLLEMSFHEWAGMFVALAMSLDTYSCNCNSWLCNLQGFDPIILKGFVFPMAVLRPENRNWIFFTYSNINHQMSSFKTTQHYHIKFMIEHEYNNSLPFLNCNIIWENEEFSITVFRTKSFIGSFQRRSGT